jgi:hypothetical protein
MTIEELKELTRDVQFKKDAPYAITNVSHTQLSIARHYGGCKYNGYDYTYFPEEDTLIRNDVLKWAVEERNRRQKDAFAMYDLIKEAEANQQELPW